jgi:hypothetical protein
MLPGLIQPKKINLETFRCGGKARVRGFGDIKASLGNVWERAKLIKEGKRRCVWVYV